MKVKIMNSTKCYAPGSVISKDMLLFYNENDFKTIFSLQYFGKNKFYFALGDDNRFRAYYYENDKRSKK